MNDDDERGGGTLVIQPGAPNDPRVQQAAPYGTPSPVSAPLPSSGPYGEPQPMPTQVLPITPADFGGPMQGGPMQGGAPMPAAGRPAQQGASPSFRPGQTLALPSSNAPLVPGSIPPPGSGSLPSSQSAQGGFGQSPSSFQPQSAMPSSPPLPSPWPDPPTVAPDARAADAPTEVTGARRGNALTLVVAGLIALVLGLGIGGTMIVLKREKAAANASASAVEPSAAAAPADEPTASTTTAAPVETTTPSAQSNASSVTSGPPPIDTTRATPTATAQPQDTPTAASGPEAEALAALEKLKTSLEHCTKNGTHVLPGTSPPVPTSLLKLKQGAYTPQARDFAASFFHCTEFRIEKPMSFLIQWQLDEPSWRGMGVAWIDTNADGEIDKAYAFYAQLKKRDEVQFAPIEPMDPTKRSPIPR